MSTLTSISPTLWQRSVWWVERLSSRGGDIAALGLGTLLLIGGMAVYIATASQYTTAHAYLQKLETEQKRLATRQLEHMSRLEALRSPERLSKLAQTYRMVPPSPKSVWRIK